MRVRFLSAARRPPDERLLWSRDTRFVRLVAALVDDGRLLDLESGAVLIGSASAMTDRIVSDIAESANAPEYGLVEVDPFLAESERYLVAMSSAVQLSGLAERIGMAPSTHLVQTKMLDYFFSLRTLHKVAYQPIVNLETGDLYEHECLVRPEMPMLPQSITSVVQAAINTKRSVELDVFIISKVIDEVSRLETTARAEGRAPRRFAINLAPSSLLDSAFGPKALTEQIEAAGLSTRQITIECTEQQSVPDIGELQRRVKALRKAGFGFAVDDAGAGYASFAMIAALKPSVIKIDRDIVHGIGSNDAKQALVEAFVSFGRRLGAHLLAEGIERRSDLDKLRTLGVELGQGYLLGRPAPEPMAPRQATAPRGAARIRAPRARVTASGVHPRARVPSRA